MSIHSARIHWQRDGFRFTDNQYSRAHTWAFDGGVVIQGSSSPLVVPAPMSNASAVDPEEAFAASLSSCHMLWFLDLARSAGFVVERYDDDASATLGSLPDGRKAITLVALNPSVKFSGPAPTPEVLKKLHDDAHHKCFLANAVSCEMTVTPTQR